MYYLILQALPAEPSFIKREIANKLKFSTQFNKSDTTVRRGHIKIDRKKPKVVKI